MSGLPTVDGQEDWNFMRKALEAKKKHDKANRSKRKNDNQKFDSEESGSANRNQPSNRNNGG